MATYNFTSGGGSCPDAFIECTSLNFSYDIFGIVSVSYSMISNSPGFCYETIIYAGHVTFKGYVSSMSMKPITGTVGWYETQVVLTTEGN